MLFQLLRMKITTPQQPRKAQPHILHKWILTCSELWFYLRVVCQSYSWGLGKSFWWLWCFGNPGKISFFFCPRLCVCIPNLSLAVGVSKLFFWIFVWSWQPVLKKISKSLVLVFCQLCRRMSILWVRGLSFSLSFFLHY